MLVQCNSDSLPVKDSTLQRDDKREVGINAGVV